MWSVAMTDLFQSVMIIVGLALVAWVVGDMAGGPGKIIAASAEAGRFEFWPKGGTKEWFAFATAFLTLAIRSIPQQDILPRLPSAHDEKTGILGRPVRRPGRFFFLFWTPSMPPAPLLAHPRP